MQPQGVLAFLTRITGIRYLTEARHRRQDVHRQAEHKRQREALARRHGRETQDFSRHEKTLKSIEKRERRSLETALRREAFNAVAVPDGTGLRNRVREGAARAGDPPAAGLTTSQRRVVDQFRANAADIATPPPEPPGGRRSAAGRDTPPLVTPVPIENSIGSTE